VSEIAPLPESSSVVRDTPPLRDVCAAVVDTFAVVVVVVGDGMLSVQLGANCSRLSQPASLQLGHESVV
jgi:hypothetical protein